MPWLIESWWRLLHPAVAATTLALAALVCGAWIGVEREKHEKPAGLRTLILVCLGAAVFTMVGFCFTSVAGDSGRVAAQIVTGIGFLGAGVILHERRTVSGATTAATIWVTAATGMTIGAGFPVAGLGLTLLVRGVLSVVKFYEHRVIDRANSIHVRVVYHPANGKTHAHLARILADAHVAGGLWQTADADRHILDVFLEMPLHKLREMIGDFASLDQVISIEESIPKAPGKKG